MPETVFQGLFDTDMTAVITVTDFLLCVGCALLIGLLLTASFIYRSRCTGSFAVTLLLLPAVVCVVIMMVNGNVGAGVAVAGAFSLVRFRSVPGTGKEITVLFLAMGAGLICGVGYLGYALLFTVIMCLLVLLCARLDPGARSTKAAYKTMTVTIPEDLNYTQVFDDIFEEYTRSWELVRVKTTNMGSMYRLTYDLVLRDVKREKEMIDALRCRNGNLEIALSRQETPATQL